jgi:hypothetical protein
MAYLCECDVTKIQSFTIEEAAVEEAKRPTDGDAATISLLIVFDGDWGIRIPLRGFSDYVQE